MALVNDGTMMMADQAAENAAQEPVEQPADEPADRPVDKKVYLLAAFRDGETASDGGPTTGMAEDVVAVIGMADGRQRFEWVGAGQEDSVANPALVTPVKVRLALPSPWHPDGDGIVTGLVQLAPAQLGDGTIDEDIDHLLAELAKTRAPGPTSADAG